MAETAARLASLRHIASTLERALHDFTASSSTFCVVKTVNPQHPENTPKTLFILDSSFNPPSIAHLSLATSAICNPFPADALPHRLLLLFSTHNADKAPSPASFAQRLTLMTIFAEDLLRSFRNPSKPLDGSLFSLPHYSDRHHPSNLTIDIGLTKEPYYTDKSAAISDVIPTRYTSGPKHVHLVGYDTLKRFVAAKYYPNHTPPLSGLTSFFSAGHKLRVTQRPSDPSDGSSAEYGTVEEQAAFLNYLGSGGLENEGFQREWVRQIYMVPGEGGVGVSSTRIRKAAKEGDWKLVGELCTEGVASWVKEMGLYGDEAD
ncbi:Nucleotidylyl transferase [Lepidopterella palustris CBS 459.81]|uniref:Nucleotidylyl transferase n=1 Tax=Lepidopterella palustris CBS 459.81 TaxID=1314670 RepID=A0A8E2E0V1_9PEZI|nr:Nucleotidylyl transferase [Lepidopterella palustris CBS 459.81]